MIDAIKKEIGTVTTTHQLLELKSKLLGKQGIVANMMQDIAKLSIEEKRERGREANTLKTQIEELIASRQQYLDDIKFEAELNGSKVDLSLPPSNYIKKGKLHPLTIAKEEIALILKTLGFTQIDGPEMEDQWHNFEALNIAPNHPARQMHDTFYLEDGLKLLRTHTSNVQIRHMTQHKQMPIKVFSIGRVYRCDSDATHTPQFHQVEGLFIGDKQDAVSVVDLKSYVQAFLNKFFDVEQLPIRMRPSYFPFTEPSMEIDILCDRSNKDEIKFATGEDWLEVMGCGMVHPQVLINVGLDPSKHQGFAFGFGLERLTMLKYSIADLREMFAADLQWLKHFGQYS